jgi:hypothetical protein
MEQKIFSLHYQVSNSPRVWWPRRPIALGALVLALGVVAAVLWPDDFGGIFNRNRETRQIGVPIGVPDAPEPAPVVQNTADVEAPTIAPSPVAENVANAAPVESAPSVAENANARSISNEQSAEPLPPVAGPDDSSSNASADNSQQPVVARQESVGAEVAFTDAANQSHKNVDQPIVAGAAEVKVQAKSKLAASTTNPRSFAAARRARATQMQADAALPPLRSDNYHARFLGTTPDGNLILGLPSGETAIVPPQYSERYTRRRVFIEKRRFLFLPLPFPRVD